MISLEPVSGMEWGLVICVWMRAGGLALVYYYDGALDHCPNWSSFGGGERLIRWKKCSRR